MVEFMSRNYDEFHGNAKHCILVTGKRGELCDTFDARLTFGLCRNS